MSDLVATERGRWGPRGGQRLRAAVRRTGSSEAIITVLSVVLAFVAGAVVIAVSDTVVLHKWGQVLSDPLGALSTTASVVGNAYGALLKGAVLDPTTVSDALGGGSLSAALQPISETAVAATPLMLSGLAVTLAFRAGLFNIGGQGQAIVGAVAAGYVGFHFNLPPGILLAAALAAGIVAGGLWSLGPGWLKSRTGAHEVITTIMLNYVASILIVYLLADAAFRRPGRTDPISPLVHSGARLPQLLGSGLRVNAGLLVGLVTAVGLWWLLSRMTVGFELRAVGQNLRAAQTAGIRVGRVYVLAMALSGAVAGLAGATIVLGTDFALTPDTASSIGFSGISVALLGRATIKGTVAAGFLFGGLQAGGLQMQAATGTPSDLVTIIEALIVLFIGAPLLVRAIFRLRAGRSVSPASTTARGWSA